jgi:hypothetical protein
MEIADKGVTSCVKSVFPSSTITAMHASVVQILLCPICHRDLRATGTFLSCKTGHSFDFARQGYVNLVHNKPSVRIR